MTWISTDITCPSTSPLSVSCVLTPGPSIFKVTDPAGTPVRTKRPSWSSGAESEVPTTLTVQPLAPDSAPTPPDGETLPTPGASTAPWSTDAPLAPALGSSGAVRADEPPQPDSITPTIPARNKDTTTLARRMTLAS